MALHEPLDLEYWFVNVFSGSIEIFALISILAITWACSYFRMQMSAFAIMIILYAGILMAYGVDWLLILLILLLAPLLFWITRRVTE